MGITWAVLRVATRPKRRGVNPTCHLAGRGRTSGARHSQCAVTRNVRMKSVATTRQPQFLASAGSFSSVGDRAFGARDLVRGARVYGRCFAQCPCERLECRLDHVVLVGTPQYGKVQVQLALDCK